MKRTLALTAVTAVLALSLAACGAERANGGMPDSGNIAGGTTATDTTRNDDGETGTGTSGGAATNSNTAMDGLGSVTGAIRSGREPTRSGMANADDRSGYAVGGPNSSVYSAAYNRGVTQEQAAARSRFERMMANARVHDTDGFLFDGENSSWGTL